MGSGRCIPASETTLQRFAGPVFAPGQSLWGLVPPRAPLRGLYTRIAGVSRRFLNHEKKTTLLRSRFQGFERLDTGKSQSTTIRQRLPASYLYFYRFRVILLWNEVSYIAILLFLLKELKNKMFKETFFLYNHLIGLNY